MKHHSVFHSRLGHFIEPHLPTRCCYQPGVVTNRVLLTTECCYRVGVVNKGGYKRMGKTTFHTLAPKGGFIS